jgi:MG2 domain
MAVRHARPIFILALLFCAALPSLGTSGELISVSEANIAFHLFPETRLEVPVFNHANRVVRASLTVEMLGNDSNAVIARHERVFEAKPGSCTVTLDWPLDELPTKSVAFLSAYRLRYRLTPTRESDFQSVQGILQLGLHMVDGFGIQGYPSGEFACALDCSFLVRVAEPNTGRGLAGYDIKAEFSPDNDQTVMHAVSDADGYATIYYDVPSDYARPEVMMGLTVSRGPFSSGWVGEIFWRVPPHLTLTTDKHTYHSGETVRMSVVLTGVNRRRWAGGNLNLTITNVSNSQELVKKKLVTSQAGEAAAEWTVPGNIESGDFSIAAVSEDEPQANWTAKDRKTIDIVTEEQPSFAVSAVTDRDYYLPGQIANLTVAQSLGVIQFAEARSA